MQYLSYIGNTLAMKNKLERDVYNFLHEQERKLIVGQDLDLFKADILLGIAKLEAIHSRCRPLKVGWWSPRGNDWLLTGAGFCTFHLFASKV